MRGSFRIDRSFAVFAAFLTVLFMAACGSSTSRSNNNGSTASSGGGNPSPTPAPSSIDVATYHYDLHAYDATNLATELYNSNQAPAACDQFAGNKFITPMIANGKVFIGTPNSVAVFGLLQTSLLRRPKILQ